MIDLLIIKDKNRKSLLYGLSSLFFETEEYDVANGSMLQELLEGTPPDFILTDIKRPADGNDLMSMVSTLDEFSRLRVFHINFRLKRNPQPDPSLHQSVPQS